MLLAVHVMCVPDRASGMVLSPGFRAHDARDEAVLCRRGAHRGFITVVSEVCHSVHLHLMGSRETEDERRLMERSELEHQLLVYI
jgi:hypothetical protein